MSRKILSYCLAAAAVILVSCDSGHESLSTFDVTKKDFTDIVSIEGSTEPVKSITLQCPTRVDGNLTFIVEDGTFVNEGDTICIIEDREIENEYDQVYTNLENGRANLTKTVADLNLQYALLDAQVKNNIAQTQIASLDSLQLSYMTPLQRRITELELQSVKIENDKYQSKLKALEVIQQSEIRRREIEIQRLETRLETSRQRINALIVRSPGSGIVVRALSWMTGEKLLVGDNVWSSHPLVSIPEMDRMKVMIKSPETEFKYISEGDSVVYTFDAMPGEMAFGKITKKTPAGQPVKRNSKVKVFEIEASIDSVTTMPGPGLTANCAIYVKEVKDVIVVPQIAVFEEDSIKAVFVKAKKGYEMREVKTGLFSAREIVITEGLSGDEKITLTRPKESSIKLRTILTEPVTVPEDEDETPEEIQNEEEENEPYEE